ncbi:hypothetical protein ACM66B_003957 [Microbotryomycetes sp. NB124-2]
MYQTCWQQPAVPVSFGSSQHHPLAPEQTATNGSAPTNGPASTATAPEAIFNVLSPVFVPDDDLVHPYAASSAAAHPHYALTDGYHHQQPLPGSFNSAALVSSSWQHPLHAHAHTNANLVQRPRSTPSSTTSSTMAAGPNDFDQMQQRPLLASVYRRLSHSADEDDDVPAPPTKRKRVLKARPAAPEGVVITEKSCARCRIRKVKCDRVFPVCANCKLRGEDCDLISLHPRDKQTATSREQQATDRITQLESRLAHLEAFLEGKSSVSETGSVASESPAANHGETSAVANIGHSSLDWQLATPVMAKSLSQHLCEAFFDSCCFLLPAFSYYRHQLESSLDLDSVPEPTKLQVAIAAFCAIGARASPHSALLGIEASDDPDKSGQRLSSAGARRHSACQVLVDQAHLLSYKQALADETTVDSLAALLALLQMTSFCEVVPRKSRTTLRIALGHYKELQDRAVNDDEARGVQRQFGFALFTIDALNSAYARRSCLVTSTDLERYFASADIDSRSLPDESLANECKTLIESTDNGVRLVLHQIASWTGTCQRKFAILSSPGPRPLDSVDAAARDLLASIDCVRAVVKVVQAATSSNPCPTTEAHDHDSDHLAIVVRHDRDLLDLIALLHMMLSSLRQPGLPDLLRLVERRARRALKVQAFYFKFYAQGADAHMSYHSFQNLELVPTWTKMALQRLGDPDGPRSPEEELTKEELDWLVEGVRNACFYTPAAERRLNELTRFVDKVQVRDMPVNAFARLTELD